MCNAQKETSPTPLRIYILQISIRRRVDIAMFVCLSVRSFVSFYTKYSLSFKAFFLKHCIGPSSMQAVHMSSRIRLQYHIADTETIGRTVGSRMENLLFFKIPHFEVSLYSVREGKVLSTSCHHIIQLPYGKDRSKMRFLYGKIFCFPRKFRQIQHLALLFSHTRV